jgi:SRSO17 transposase
LPKAWCDDAERRAEARIPEAVRFQTKPQLAQQMLARAWGEGIPMQWVVADSTYGNSPGLRNFIRDQHRSYVMEVPQTLHVRLAKAAPPQAVSELVSPLEAQQWRRLAFGFGEKGLNFYDWAAIRVTPTTDEVGEQWLLLRRSLENDEITYYLSNAPVSTPLEVLAEVASARWCIERLLEEAKGEAGLADYEVRHWQAWYRHITLSMVAHTWLTLVRHEERKKTVLAGMADGQFGRTAQVAEYPVAASGAQCCLPVEVAGVAAQETSASHSVPLPRHAPSERFPSIRFAA